MGKRKKMQKISPPFLCALLIMITLSGIVGTQAFLVKGSDRLLNRIIPGQVAVTLSEPEWIPENGERMFPGQIAAKDPYVTNTGTLPVWIFLKVRIPVREIAVVDGQTHRKTEKKKTELVRFQTDQDWMLLERQLEDTGCEYLFGYQKKVEPKEATSHLFDRIEMVNYLEGELSAKEPEQIPIEAIAIQGSVADADEGIEAAYRYSLGGVKDEK